MNAIQKLIYKRNISRIRRTVNTGEYMCERMKRMSDEVAYWEHHEISYAKLIPEREFCKRMQDIYMKRFLWHQNRKP